MYYKDLTNYKYYLPFGFEEVLNIGWLDKKYVFNQSFVDGEIIDKLVSLLCENSIFNATVNKIRGFHPCNICGLREPKFYCYDRQYDISLGNCEIWIPSKSKNIYYASPSMIIHYIQDHLYCPPQEFLNSINKIKLDEKYNGQEIYDSLIEKYRKSKAFF